MALRASSAGPREGTGFTKLHDRARRGQRRRGSLGRVPGTEASAMTLALVLAVALAGGSSFSKIDWSRGLSRDAFSQPERVIDALAIAPGARVADLGAGDGYFVGYLADAVGP